MHRGNLDLRAVCVYLCVCVFGVLKCVSKNQPGARKAEKVIHLLQGVGWGHFGKGFPPFSLSRLPTFTPLTGSVVKKKKKIHLPMQETQVRCLGWKDLPEEEMATHSSILAWEIPWTEEPGGIQSMGLQRIKHD